MTGNQIQVEIRRALAVLYESGNIVELRVLATRQGTLSGYFDDFDALASAAAELDGTAPGIYVTLNPANPDLLARASNRTMPRARATTADSDIVRRRWIAFDFDPARASGISSTDAEKETSLDCARSVWRFLSSLGWPEPVVADSGNGTHLLYRIDLPNDDAARELISNCLEAVAFRFSDSGVSVDTSVGNAARIWKLYGTLACKGESLSDRPHRRSRLIRVPTEIQVVPGDELAALAALTPQHTGSRKAGSGEFDIERWIAENELNVAFSAPWKGGQKWILETCPWNPEHTNQSAYILRLSSGAIAAGCHHNSCQHNRWAELRALYKRDAEPEDQTVQLLTHDELAGTPTTGTSLSYLDAPPRLLTAQEFAEDREPEPIVPNLIYKGSTHLLTGHSKAGKSYLALQLAACVATGVPFLELKVVRTPVLVISLEMTAGMVRGRMHGICYDVGVPMPALGSGFEIVAPTRDANPELDLGSDPGWAHLYRLIRDAGAGLVILDTLYRFIPGLDPSSNSDMGRFFGKLNHLAHSTGCAVLPLDHVAKGEQLGPVSHSALGAQIKGGASRVIIGLKRTSKEDGGRWRVEVESHFGGLDEPLHYQRPLRSDGTRGSGCVPCSQSEAVAINYEVLKGLFERLAPKDGDGRPCLMSKKKLTEALIAGGYATGNGDAAQVIRAIEADYCVADGTRGWGEDRPIVTRPGPRRATIYTWRGLPEPQGDIPF